MTAVIMGGFGLYQHQESIVESSVKEKENEVKLLSYHINSKITELKKTSGKPVSIGDVAGEAKKDWVAIKAGKHPKYSQGKAKSFTRKHKKSPKHHHNENKNNEDVDDVVNNQNKDPSILVLDRFIPPKSHTQLR